MSVKVNALDHLVINVSDVARSTEWYRKILGMEVRVFDPGPGKTPRTSLVFGNQKINVRPRDADKVEWFTADHETAGSDDLCFLTASTPTRWSRISTPTASRSRRARSPNKAPAARCVRSIAAIPTAA
jgi:catechol 2,3-dioxygenase-like lactoylglutathione lyase family enzyme